MSTENLNIHENPEIAPEGNPLEAKDGADLTVSAEQFLENYDARTEQEIQDFDANIESFDTPTAALEHAELGMVKDALLAEEVMDREEPSEDGKTQEGGMTNPMDRFSRKKGMHALLASALLATSFAAPKDAHAGGLEDLVKVGVGVVLAKRGVEVLERHQDRREEADVEIQRERDLATIENDLQAQLQVHESRVRSLEQQRIRAVANLTRAQEAHQAAQGNTNPSANDRNAQYELQRLQGNVRTQQNYVNSIDRQLENMPLQEQRIIEQAEQSRIYANQRANDQHIYRASDRAQRRNQGY